MRLFAPLILLLSCSLSLTTFSEYSEDVDLKCPPWGEQSDTACEDSSDDGDVSCGAESEDYGDDTYYPETRRNKHRYWYQQGFDCERIRKISKRRLEKQYAQSRRDKGNRRAAKTEKCFKAYLKALGDLQDDESTSPQVKSAAEGEFRIPAHLEEHAMKNANPCPKRHEKHQRRSASEFRNYRN